MPDTSEHLSKPQIAIVCDTIPYPIRSGDNQRIAELIKVLRERGWYVHLVLCGFLDAPLKRLSRAYVDALHVYSGIGMKTRVRNLARRAVRATDRVGKVIGVAPLEEIARQILGRSLSPIILDYWQRYPNGLDRFVGELAGQFPWRAVIVEYIWLHKAIDKLNESVLRLMDTHDIQHQRVAEFASRGMVFPLKINREDESRILNKFDAVIAIQAAEALVIREMCPHPRVITVGSSGSSFAFEAARSFDGRILYVGGYNGANVDGLRRFLYTVWPSIREQNPHARLDVCGYIYRAFLGEQFENVRFLGHKETVETDYAEAAVVINPAWIGTGLKIKTIEALARGKALVTTPKGIEGLPHDIMRSAVVVDDDRKFAIELNRLLTDQQARQRLSRAALAFADLHLNKHAVYRELFEFLDQQN
jgi:glycosyltransferase involved in cell wall biosynthesis